MAHHPRVTIRLSGAELQLILEGLDAHEYWQLGDLLPRSNGAVFIPGDLDPPSDPYWGTNPNITSEQAKAIEAVQRVRALADRLQDAADEELRP